MVVELRSGIDRAQFALLISQLEREQFADRCFIEKIEPINYPGKAQLRIALCNKVQGVLVDVDKVDENGICWVVEQLRLSAGG